MAVTAPAPGADAVVDDVILDHVGEHPDLLPDEKETTISFLKRDDCATVFTDEAALGRRLLAHPESALRPATVVHAMGARTVEAVESLRGLSDGATVCGVVVTVPVALLTLKRFPPRGRPARERRHKTRVRRRRREGRRVTDAATLDRGTWSTLLDAAGEPAT
jgi:hypothetical protein